MIVVAGEALMDMVATRDGTQQPRPGGGPFNTARALARLGVPTAFLGRLSTDAFGRQLAAALVADGADLSLTSLGPEPTTLAIAEVDSRGYAAYRFVTAGTSAPNLTPAGLPASLAPDVNALHVGTLGLLLEPIAATLFHLVQREGGRRLVMVDPNIRPALLTNVPPYRDRLDAIMAHSTIVKGSEADLAWLYPELEVEAAAERLLGLGPRLVIATLGAQGALGASAGIRVRVPAPIVDVVDTIGAGDAFGAAVLAWLHEHGALTTDLSLDAAHLRSVLDFACLAASLTCTRPGADPPWRSELGPMEAIARTHDAAGD
ncbi:MAG: carbohydrate kinase [Chloroflexi bacterium]|nr:MAG: carbohydrate kinase [Chloroflexota bacterium]